MSCHMGPESFAALVKESGTHSLPIEFLRLVFLNSLLCPFMLALYSLQRSKIKKGMESSFCDLLKICPYLRELK